MSDQTQPMPPAQPGQPARPPAGGAAGPLPRGPAGPPPQGPEGPSAQGPAGPPPQGPGPGTGPGEPSGRRPGLWRQATSTTGGKIATGVALALTGLLLLGVLATGIFALTRIGHRFDDRRETVSQLRDGPGMGAGDRGMGPGGRQQRGDGLGGNRNGNGKLPGSGVLGRLGNVQHGELSVTGTDGKAVVMTVQRGQVTAASATSVAVRSDDGFAQTYVVNGSTRVAGGTAADLKAGDDVLVLARKDGRVAVQIRPDRR